MVVKKNAAPESNLLNDYHLLSFDALDSTNEEAKRLARNGGSHGAVIWAKRQTAGKGRMGREWVSQEGNLFVSILLNPDKALSDLGQLSFVAAVAAVDALAGMPPADAKLECKWPNDILLSGRKLGGILLESFQDNGRHWVVVGVGINVDSFPSDARFPAICLKEAGVELVSAKIILSRFIHHFIERYNEWNRKGFGFARKAWVMSAWGLNRRLRVKLPDDEIEGMCEGIDTKGSLLLRGDDGNRREIHAGDVTPVEAMQLCS